MDEVGLLARQFFLTRRTREDGIGRLQWREMWEKVGAFRLPARLPIVGFRIQRSRGSTPSGGVSYPTPCGI
jgi:hypothetical protein